MNINNQDAFPHSEPCEPPEVAGWAYHKGMSLRDYFAAKAMEGIISQTSEDKWPSATPEALAQCAYQTADAMLAERSKSQ